MIPVAAILMSHANRIIGRQSGMCALVSHLWHMLGGLGWWTAETCCNSYSLPSCMCAKKKKSNTTCDNCQSSSSCWSTDTITIECWAALLVDVWSVCWLCLGQWLQVDITYVHRVCAVVYAATRGSCVSVALGLELAPHEPGATQMGRPQPQHKQELVHCGG